MRILYNILFVIFFWLSAPCYLLKMWRRGNWRAGFMQRFGRYQSRFKQALTNRQVIWLHAVSVGEVNLCTQLIQVLERRVPTAKMVVSTTTSTGMDLLRKRLPPRVEKIYFPVDRRRAVSRALLTIHPQAIVLVEAEIWPNFLWRAIERRIPLFLVNARLSERSYRGYRRFAPLFRPLFAAFKGVGAQNEKDAARLRELGCRPENVHVIGNLKFDAAKLDTQPYQLDVQAIFRQIGVAPDAPILLGGSTHPGEEAILADLFLRLRHEFPHLFLVLVPRHHERGHEVGSLLEKRGIPFVYRSHISRRTRHPPGRIQCLLVNTTGELKFFYQPATVIFVGKSLAGQGGQSPIEPAALAKPIVFGPHMQNFTAIAAQFREHDGAVQISDEMDLEKTVRALLTSPERREELGRNALEVVKRNLGAVERTTEMIVRQLDREEIYIAPETS